MMFVSMVQTQPKSVQIVALNNGEGETVRPFQTPFMSGNVRVSINLLPWEYQGLPGKVTTFPFSHLSRSVS